MCAIYEQDNTFIRITSSESRSDSSKTQFDIQLAIIFMPLSMPGISTERKPYIVNLLRADRAAEVRMPFPYLETITSANGSICAMNVT